MTSRKSVQLRRLMTCLDFRRVPLNREQRSYIQGSIPYWGAGGPLDSIAEWNFNETLVLLGEDGAPFFEAGRDVAYLVEGKVWINNHIHVLRPEPCVDPRYLTYALNAVDYGSYITGATRDKLTQDDMNTIEIPLVVLDEQRRIADFLDAETARIDRLRSLQSMVLNRLAERENAIRDHLIDALSSAHGQLPLRRFIWGIEQGASPQCENSPRENGEWAVLKLSAVKNGRFAPDENKRLPDDEEPTGRYEVQLGDLLITRANTPELVGDVAVVSSAVRKLLLPDLIYRVVLEKGMRSDFVAQVALSSRVRQVIESTARGSSQSMVKLRGEDIKAWPIPIADEAQQIALLAAIEREQKPISELREVINRQLALLAERRQALITAAVTGQIDVTTARGFDSSGGSL